MNNNLNKIILFGAGNYGEIALNFIGSDNVSCFLDNDIKKDGIIKSGKVIHNFNKWKENIGDELIVVSVLPECENEITKKLDEAGISNYIGFQEYRYNAIKEKIVSRDDYIGVYNKAIQWVKNNSLDGRSIICTTGLRKGYPEVTGYFIPSLLRWGYRDLAIRYAKWLCEIQKSDGSWYDTEDIAPYVFDSGQILKGLLAIRNILPEVDGNIIKGCDWIISRMQQDGRLVTPSTKAWGDDKDFCDEVIHIYCISPLMDAAKIFNKPEYDIKAKKIWQYYKENYYQKIVGFKLLSHFQSYLYEALIDIGEEDLARQAMDNIATYQKESGAVPAYNNCDWVCSTGLFQLAVCWFRLGEYERGRRAFEYACKLQNESGGWYGSYLSDENPAEDNTYIPAFEISWAVKYFLDALHFMMVCNFNQSSKYFLERISKEDERYKIVLNELKDSMNNIGRISVLDIGCGKGRYLNNLIEDEQDNDYFAVDLSDELMKAFDNKQVDIKIGALTNIPFEDDSFDFVYTCEALEHAVDIESSIREMVRVTKKGGKILIVDKCKDKLGMLEIGTWEQWFDDNEMITILDKYCDCVNIYKDISYENNNADGLFHAWVGSVV